MNKTDTPTNKKITYPLRLPPGIYKKIRNIVKEKQDEGNYAFSINELITSLIEKGLKKEKSK